jgi:hypothetical protein
MEGASDSFVLAGVAKETSSATKKSADVPLQVLFVGVIQFIILINTQKDSIRISSYPFPVCFSYVESC